MNAREIVEAGKTAGIELTQAYVHNIRHNLRKAAKHPIGRSKVAGAKDAAFLALVLKLGTNRANELVDELEGP